jgi:hypothetical protein
LSAAGAAAASWTCCRCEVTSSFAATADAPPIPEGWAALGDEWICLGCRRIEAADNAKPGDASGRTARRRRALAEFELRRDPEAANHVIAKRVNCPTHFIAPIRDDLIDAGEIASA